MRKNVDALGNVHAPDMSNFVALTSITEVRGKTDDQKTFSLLQTAAPSTPSHHCSAFPLPQPVTLKSVPVTVQFAADGSLATLNISNVQWSDSMGQFGYKTYNYSDWVPFSEQFMVNGQMSGGFSKVGSNNYSECRFWLGQVQAAYVSKDGNSVAARIAMPSKAVQAYGAPSTVFVVYDFTTKGNGVAANLTLTWLEKTPTMIGESISLLFAPSPARVGAWSIDKLGRSIDPEDVIDGGNQFNHASWGGAAVPTKAGTFSVRSLDAPNMNPMTQDWPQSNALPAGEGGGTEGILRV